ncbi:MAG: hypothetical protein NT051_06210 [Candidatus Micrarchaeota archaeon]|nr:hypothetical protein [Candidatus Micrarchaeota archaeon]
MKKVTALSDPEKHVAHYFDILGIRYAAQRPVIVRIEGYHSSTFQVGFDGNREIRIPLYDREFPDYYIMKPDFYLLDFHVYVEVMCAGTRKDYNKRKKTYKENGVPIIFLDFARLFAWKKYFILELKDMHKAYDARLKKVIENAEKIGIETTGYYI